MTKFEVSAINRKNLREKGLYKPEIPKFTQVIKSIGNLKIDSKNDDHRRTINNVKK
jgi:hypothetical protein